MGTPKKVVQLVERFQRNLDAYRSGKYNETQVRQEFINPFFIALGWDVNNEKGYAEAYKDVIHEDAIKVGGATKAPDYCFRIGGTRKFFLEAKKPSVSIKDAPHPAYQLRRYAWSAKLPLSILTDFEEFAVYDCRVKPVSADKASTARTLYIEYPEYPDRWDEIASVFSHEEVLKGSFDKYVESTKRKKGTAEVNSAFLKEIESWREMLARNIALRNPKLTQRELNFAVQRTIDRIIFLRICEDRGVETYGRLMSLLNGDGVYKRLCHLFHQADDRYNSGLFHFRKEKDRAGPPDELTLSLKIDDKLLKDMLRRLYYPESPYEFSVLPADILGQVYEQFLGKVIRLTAGHRAKVEDKPEVKKAGGVYYTPTYIVDYIVKNTVGRLIWGYPADADGTCLACKRKGLGARDWGLAAGESGEQYDQSDQELQGSSSLARGHGAGGADVRVDGKTAGKREVWPETSDASSSGIRACQYCGRPCIQPSEGVSEPSQHGQGFADRAGDLCSPDDETPIRDIGARSGNSAADSKSREVAQRSHPVSEGEALTPSRKSLTPRRAARLRILDPACGSGSFLIGAYQYLLDWHRDYYTNDDPEKWARKRPARVYQGSGGDWRLTSAERKRILLNNIYGVDIDSQAVEVTKLSLLLKVLEGESTETIGKTLELFHERALPDLTNNIKCGNSLIGPDYYDNKQMGLFDDEERYRINAFDWHAEFPQIFKRKTPGFDAVIGNPPYRRELGYKHLMDEIASTQFGTRYRAPRMDLWYYFVHRGLELLGQTGSLSFITNAYWTAGTGAEKLITGLRERAHVDEIFYLKKLRVFRTVAGQHTIIRISKATSSEPTTIKLVEPEGEKTAEPFVVGRASVTVFSKTATELFRGAKLDLEPPSGQLLSKLDDWAPLCRLGKVRQGIAENPASISRKTNEKYGQRWKVGEGVFALRPAEVKRLKLPKRERDLLRPYHHLCDLGRYRMAPTPSLVLIYSTRSTCPDIDNYHAIRNHLRRFKAVMDVRRETRKGSNDWWHLHWPRDENVWQASKILSLQMGQRPAFVPAYGSAYVPFSVNVFVPSDATREHLNYVSGLLNSRVLWKWYQHNAKRRGVGLEINGHVLGRTPIRTIDFSDPKDKDRHDRMVKLVNRMLSLHKQLVAAKTAHDRTVIQRQIDATDRQIDRLVYELYDLTDEDIRIVEESTK